MMGMSLATWWWVLAGAAVAVELATGTFYLLMLALGFAAGACAAHLGLTLSMQIVVFAIVGGGATALWHWHRARQPATPEAAKNRDVNLDINDRVFVEAWAQDRTSRVKHRGSVWAARLAPGLAPQSGEHVIRAIEGNWLVLEPAAKH
jgi:membrane protein implicated in regulation of membrane protease activity